MRKLKKAHAQVSSSLIDIAAEVGFPRLDMQRFLMATLASSPALCSPVPKPLIVSRLNQERKPKSALSRSSLYCPSEARRNTNRTSVICLCTVDYPLLFKLKCFEPF